MPEKSLVEEVREVMGIAQRERLPVLAVVLLLALREVRALRYQLDSLAEHVTLLPDGQVLAAPLRRQLAALDALALCDCFVHELAGARGRAPVPARPCASLRQVLDDIWRGGNELADALARRYFTHLDARSRATVSL